MRGRRISICSPPTGSRPRFDGGDEGVGAARRAERRRESTPATIDAFEKWIGEREGIAKETRLMGVTSRYAGW